MKTVWGERLDAADVLTEYPRPQMVRESYVNLNGLWEYAITRQGDAPPAAYDGQILVPFSPECELSGVQRMVTPDDWLWYRRTFSLKQAADCRTLLHFGAVDQSAEVFLNGVSVGWHAGGYLPFTLDISAHVRAENTLVVRVKDVSDTAHYARGKQRIARGGIWYTPQSGIWQTVWLEEVPSQYIRALRITPLFDESAAEVTVLSDAAMSCVVTFDGAAYAGVANAPIRVPVPQMIPWSPEVPHLYPFRASMGQDAVDSYFAMRKFSVERDESGVPRLFLNNRPYFHNGVLDQGYWSDGMYTAPHDEALAYDIRLMKAMGFNMLRKHIKIEPLRWYYHCDRLGMLVWQDMVNGGGSYRPLTISAPLVLNNAHSDRDYRCFARADDAGRAMYRAELRETVELLYNCPCIAMWVPFNEGWGQFDALEATETIRQLDGTRTVDHASGWHDQGGGDVHSRHVYFVKYRFRPDRRGRAVVLSEFGGYGYRVEGHCFSEKTFGYKRAVTAEQLLNDYKKLYETQIIPAKEQGLAAAVYTQLSDVEDETNGFVTYDRRVEKLPTEAVAALNRRLSDAT